MLTATANEHYMQVGDYPTLSLSIAAKRQYPTNNETGQPIIADSKQEDPSRPFGLFVPVDLQGRLRVTVGPRTSGIIALEDITGIIQ